MKSYLKIELINNFVKTHFETDVLIKEDNNSLNLSFNFEKQHCKISINKLLDELIFQSKNTKEEYNLEIYISQDKNNNYCKLNTKFGIVNLEMKNGTFELNKDYLIINYQIIESNEQTATHSIIVYLK